MTVSGATCLTDDWVGGGGCPQQTGIAASCTHTYMTYICMRHGVYAYSTVVYIHTVYIHTYIQCTYIPWYVLDRVLYVRMYAHTDTLASIL